ncbi:MAG: DNA/RNA non-specific endonuclease [Lactobacillus sp.]|jgi:DNA-entry nuclease|nr:DNA/RNA non-specific endonuclease [Lactobacillus sp.]
MPKRKQPAKLPKFILTGLIAIAGLLLYTGKTVNPHTTTPTAPTSQTATGPTTNAPSAGNGQSSDPAAGQNNQQQATGGNTADLANLNYTNRQIIAVNNNEPTFSQGDLSLAQGVWQRYSDLDGLNRAGVADAMLSKALMPTAKRERLYVQPTGYHNKRITIGTHQDWLYNRCHLIGFQLTGQNNNLKNLITGTRSLNDPAMTYYENQIASYIKSTNHHVRYQVRPVFRGNELVARGIQMQGRSIEDDKIDFNIYIFNVQTGYQINYQDGTSQAG